MDFFKLPVEQGRVVSQILLRHFGEIVQKVGDDIFLGGKKSITLIVKSTQLPRSKVIESLRTLLKFDLATYEGETIVEYKLNADNVLLLIRYPRYLLQMKSKYGSEAEMIVEELLQQASCTATVLLVSIMNKYKDDKEKNINMVKLKDTFISLATAGYIQQAPVPELKDGSDIPTLVTVATIVPDLDVRELLQAMNTNLANCNDNTYWKVNYERFHLDFRDDMMIKAITQRIDDNAGELMRLMLEQMYLSSSAWAAESSPVLAIDIREGVKRMTDRPLLNQHIDQYLRVLEENGANFVRRSGEAGGGQFVLRMRRAAAALLEALLDHCVTERLGSKAARIFRLIRINKCVAEEDIQKNAMLPNKECKRLTYELLEQQFIRYQPIRKAGSAAGNSKASYLYNVDLNDAAHTARALSLRALHNVLSTAAGTRRAHARLLDKQRRVRSIVHGMRVRGEPQQHIDDVLETLSPLELAAVADAERRLRQLAAAELELDRALFLLACHAAFPR